MPIKNILIILLTGSITAGIFDLLIKGAKDILNEIIELQKIPLKELQQQKDILEMQRLEDNVNLQIVENQVKLAELLSQMPDDRVSLYEKIIDRHPDNISMSPGISPVEIVRPIPFPLAGQCNIANGNSMINDYHNQNLDALTLQSINRSNIERW